MAKINAYIHFQNNCREAMSFYQQCLGGELSLQVVKDSPMKEMFPPQLQEIVLHSSLDNGDLTLLASEVPGEDGQQSGQMVTLMLVCDSKSELIEKFGKLSEGGHVSYPVHEFFAGTMVAFKDRFQVGWNIFSAEK